MNPFIVYALPRSRTVWLSHFLTYGNWKCFHDIVVDLHSIDNIALCLQQPYVGTVETAMVDGWQAIKQAMPSAKIVVVSRPVTEVNNSLRKFGINVLHQLIHRKSKLDEICSKETVLLVQYEDLDKEEVCKQIFEYCLEQPFDRDWWLAIKDANIQLDIEKRLLKIEKNRAGIDKLKAEAKC